MESAETPPRLLYSRPEAAKMLGISLRTLDAFLAGGAIRPTRLAGRVMLSRSELDRVSAEGVSK